MASSADVPATGVTTRGHASSAVDPVVPQIAKAIPIDAQTRVYEINISLVNSNRLSSLGSLSFRRPQLHL